jgi:isoleucyl-tRNA synthetase
VARRLLGSSRVSQWSDDDVLDRLRNRHGHPEWVFYEGPPTANGRPGIHHVWARLFKDLYPRFHTMRGKHVVRKGGWDCHGLPVEVQVEKELGFSVKHEIEDYGIERFNAKCRSSVQRYVEDWQSVTSRIGMWLDTRSARRSTEHRERWCLPRDGARRDYEGNKVVPYCDGAVALSSHGSSAGVRKSPEPSVLRALPGGRDFDP